MSARSTRLLDVLDRIDRRGAAVQTRLDAVKLGPDTPEKAALWRSWDVLVGRRKKIHRAYLTESRQQRAARVAGAPAGALAKKEQATQDRERVSTALKRRGISAAQRGVYKLLSDDLQMPERTVQRHLRNLRQPR